MFFYKHVSHIKGRAFKKCSVRTFMTLTPHQIFIVVVMKSRMMKWVGHMPHMRQKTSAYMILVAKMAGKR